MEFGMPTLIENQNLEEAAILCHELGLDFIELNMNLPQYQVEVLEQTEELQEIAERYGIYYTIHLEERMDICDFNSAIKNAYFDTVRRTIESAKRLQAPIINMHMNHGVYITLPEKKIWLYEKYNDIYMENIKNFRKLCDSSMYGTNIHLSIENTDGYTKYEKKAIEYLLKSDNFTLTWDIGHSHVCENVDESFLLVHIDKLKHFHIHDAMKRKNHLTLGTGEINLADRLITAKKCEARCVIETKTIEALKKSKAWLEKYKSYNFV